MAVILPLISHSASAIAHKPSKVSRNSLSRYWYAILLVTITILVTGGTLTLSPWYFGGSSSLPSDFAERFKIGNVFGFAKNTGVVGNGAEVGESTKQEAEFGSKNKVDGVEVEGELKTEKETLAESANVTKNTTGLIDAANEMRSNEKTYQESKTKYDFETSTSDQNKKNEASTNRNHSTAAYTLMAKLPADPSRLKIYKSCQQQQLGFPTCPTAYIIGCQKCGTTNLAYWIAQSPNVVWGDLGLKDPSKEMHFFDIGTNFQVEDFGEQPTITNETAKRLVDRYVDKYPLRKSNSVVSIDATPEYMYEYFAPEALAKSGVVNLNKTRFLFLVRDPVSRFHSAVEMMKRDRIGYAHIDLFDKLHWNLTAFADICVPRINKCRKTAKEKNVSALTYCHDSSTEEDSRIRRDDPCSALYRGIYVDQIKQWLQYFPKQMFCLVSLKSMSVDPWKALNKEAGPCLKDTGVDYSGLARKLPITYPKRYDSLNSAYPGLRHRLNKELFEETNREFRNLVKRTWNIDSLDI